MVGSSVCVAGGRVEVQLSSTHPGRQAVKQQRQAAGTEGASPLRSRNLEQGAFSPDHQHHSHLLRCQALIWAPSCEVLSHSPIICIGLKDINLFHLESFFSAYISELLNQLVEIFCHTGLVKN